LRQNKLRLSSIALRKHSFNSLRALRLSNDESSNTIFKRCCPEYSNMTDEKKKETKIEKKDEFGNTVEEQEIEEKEED